MHAALLFQALGAAVLSWICWCALVRPIHQITVLGGLQDIDFHKQLLVSTRMGYAYMIWSMLTKKAGPCAFHSAWTSLAFLPFLTYPDQRSWLPGKALSEVWPCSVMLSLQLGLLFMSQVSPLLQAVCSFQASSSCWHCFVCLPYGLR